MTDHDRAAFWDGVYRQKSDQAVSWYEETPAVSLDLLVRVGARPGTAILDVGGGSSRLVDGLLDRGFLDITVLDVSAVALEGTRRRLGAAADRATFIEADITRWDPPRRFDVWHDRVAFHFLVVEADRLAYRDRLTDALTVGGHAIIATFAPDGPEKCSGLPVARQDAAGLAAFLGRGYRLVEGLRHTHRTPGGATQQLQFTVLRRIG